MLLRAHYTGGLAHLVRSGRGEREVRSSRLNRRASGAPPDELLLVTGLAPLLETNLRAEPCEKLCATDASPGGAGGCAASITQDSWLALYNLAEEKGEHLHLDWKGEEPPSNMHDGHAAAAPLAMKLYWTTMFSYRFSEGKQIKLLEPISERSEAVEVYQANAQVVKTTSHERISGRSQVMKVPNTLYWESAGVEHIPQKKISERSQVIDVPKISCQESVEVDPDLLRTVKQYLDTERESPSRFCGRIRERILEQVEKEKNPRLRKACFPDFFKPQTH